MATEEQIQKHVVIVTIPEADDRIHDIGDEPKHMTMLFLGEVGSIDHDAVLSEVAAIADEFLQFEGKVNGRGELGDENAKVLLIESVPAVKIRAALLGRTTIAEAHNSTEQFPTWLPHVTLGYEEMPPEATDVQNIIFDRIALWHGDQQTEFSLQKNTIEIEQDLSLVGGATVPWTKVHNHEECPSDRPWAVVKESNGEVEGCHTSEKDADDQLAALYASEDKESTKNKKDCEDCDYSVDSEHFGSTGASVVDKPWSGASSRFSDDEWKMATAACEPGEGTVKDRCFLPHHEPGGATNRRGVHAAAQRVSSLKRDSSASAKAKSHLRAHYKKLGEDPPASLTLTPRERQYLINQNLETFDMETAEVEEHVEVNNSWSGVLVVEGITSGDHREFVTDAITWADPPLTLRWNKEDSHGGMPQTKAVAVGTITEVWREDNKIMGRGTFDLGQEDGREAHRRVSEGFLRGVSIDADDIADADVELIWPEKGPVEAEGEDNEEDILYALFAQPEKILFHSGRIRAATLCDIPAFVEAYITLDDGSEALAASAVETYGAVGRHSTETSDDKWDASIHESRLPSPMPVGLARKMYAWVDGGAVSDGEVKKIALRLPHHEVSTDGVPGPANLTACSSMIAAINGVRGVLNIPEAQKRGAYNHLAAHLRDAGQEPPPFQGSEIALAASVVPLDDYRPPAEWFNNPNLSVPTGITVTDDGRVYGHAAFWEECHIGYPDVCVTPIFEEGHPYFMTGELVCADGAHVPVGQITVGTGHAPLTYGASRAAEHYDNTGAVVADVAVGNDDHGIWVAGAIRADATAARVRDLRAAGRVSGDWRRIGGQLRLVGLLGVNVAGFPMPSTRTRIASGVQTALVAAGTKTVGPAGVTQAERQESALSLLMDQLSKRVYKDDDPNGMR